MPNFFNPTLSGSQYANDYWGSDQDLTANLPLSPVEEYLKKKRAEEAVGGRMAPLVDSLTANTKPSAPPMFSGQGDMADRRLNVLDRTDPAAAAALRQQLATTQANHNVEMEYNRLHDQARTPVHYGSEPMAAADVAGIVARKKERDFLTGNPGMRRFLGGQPVQDAPSEFPLIESLTEGVRRDNEREYGTVGGRRASRPVGSKTWAIERRSMSELRPDEIREIENRPSPETLKGNRERYDARQKARHDAFEGKKALKAQQQHELAIAQAKQGGITGEQMDYALKVAAQNPAMRPLLQSFIEGRSGVAAAQAQASGRTDATDWHEKQLQAQIQNADKEALRAFLQAKLQSETDPARRAGLENELRATFSQGMSPSSVPIPAPPENPGMFSRVVNHAIPSGDQDAQSKVNQLNQLIAVETNPDRQRSLIAERDRLAVGPDHTSERDTNWGLNWTGG